VKISVAVAKTPKYAIRDSGDSVEIIERPLGGLSALIVDGQGSGKPAKVLSAALAGRAAGLINDGTRDGAVARSIHDWLFAQKHGRVSATITIMSLATDTKTLVITRSGHCPVLVMTSSGSISYDSSCDALGFYRYSRPKVDQVDLEPGLVAVSFSDGILTAGRRANETMGIQDWSIFIQKNIPEIGPKKLAEKILAHALSLDQQRPNDDMTVIVMALWDEPADGIRRLQVEYPMR
jgi:serine phosphatase RsbU (regulator of sigma subunit)